MNAVAWFQQGRIPKGRAWPFLSATWHTLGRIQERLVPDLDMTEGQGARTITGCIQAYRQAVMRRVLVLAQSTVILWNQNQITGAVVCARGLLETLAIFHAFLRRAEDIVNDKDWERLDGLVTTYAFARTDSDQTKKTRRGDPPNPDTPPSIGRAVKNFIAEAEPGQEHFWGQICDAAHPNGFRMMEIAGKLGDNHFRQRDSAENEAACFPAIYNALYSCCWLVKAEDDLEILLEVVRRGEPLPDEHPLITSRRDLDEHIRQVSAALASTKK